MKQLVPLLAFLMIGLTAVPASAEETEGPSSEPTTSPIGGPDGGFNIGATQEGNDNGNDGSDGATEVTQSSLPAGHWIMSDQPCDAMSNVGCQDLTAVSCPQGEQAVIWSYVRDSDGAVVTAALGCPSEPPAATPQTPPVDIPGEALTAFKKVGLPDSTINVQPPGGETLVNFKTIFSTGGARHQIPVHLDRVNIDLVLEVWPSSFTWKHGDGTTQTTAVAGSPWFKGADVDSADFVTHVYSKILKDVPVSVDTTWSAQFRVVGEPDWRPVNGTVTKEGAPLPLTVREATPELVTAPN